MEFQNRTNEPEAKTSSEEHAHMLVMFVRRRVGSRPLGVNEIKKLLDKRILADWYSKEREKHFLMISKAGFTKKC